jgi:hypothetical protein
MALGAVSSISGEEFRFPSLTITPLRIHRLASKTVASITVLLRGGDSIEVSLGTVGFSLIRSTTLISHVLRVVLFGSKEKVPRINTGSVVASVADAQTLWDRAVMKDP